VLNAIALIYQMALPYVISVWINNNDLSMRKLFNTRHLVGGG